MQLDEHRLFVGRTVKAREVRRLVPRAALQHPHRVLVAAHELSHRAVLTELTGKHRLSHQHDLRGVLHVVARAGEQHPERVERHQLVLNRRLAEVQVHHVALQNLVAQSGLELAVALPVLGLVAQLLHLVDDLGVELQRAHEVRVGPPLRGEGAHHVLGRSVAVCPVHELTLLFRVSRVGFMQRRDVEVDQQLVECALGLGVQIAVEVRIDHLAQALHRHERQLAELLRGFFLLARPHHPLTELAFQHPLQALGLVQRLGKLDNVVALVALQLDVDRTRGFRVAVLLRLGDHHVVAVAAQRGIRPVHLGDEATGFTQLLVALALQLATLAVVGLDLDQRFVLASDGFAQQGLLLLEDRVTVAEHVLDDGLSVRWQRLEPGLHIGIDDSVVLPVGLEAPLLVEGGVVDEPLHRFTGGASVDLPLQVGELRQHLLHLDLDFVGASSFFALHQFEGASRSQTGAVRGVRQMRREGQPGPPLADTSLDRLEGALAGLLCEFGELGVGGFGEHHPPALADRATPHRADTEDVGVVEDDEVAGRLRLDDFNAVFVLLQPVEFTSV